MSKETQQIRNVTVIFDGEARNPYIYMITLSRISFKKDDNQNAGSIEQTITGNMKTETGHRLLLREFAMSVR